MSTSALVALADAGDARSLRIEVKNMAGDVLVIEPFSSASTVIALKRAIFALNRDFAVPRQRLVAMDGSADGNFRVLDNRQTLHSYGFRADAVVELNVVIIDLVVDASVALLGAQHTDADTVVNFMRADAESMLEEFLHQRRGQLVLRKPGVGHRGARTLCSALALNLSIGALYVRDDEWGGVGSTAVAELLEQNVGLHTLSLESCTCGVLGAHALARALQVNGTLRTLQLMGNSIGDDGASAVAAALRDNSTLTELELGSNRISHIGAVAVLVSLHANTSITELGLSSNLLGDEGAAAVASVLPGCASLATLWLAGNEFGDTGVAELCRQAEATPALTHLDVHGNRLGAAGVESCIAAMRHCARIKVYGFRESTATRPPSGTACAVQ